MGNRIDITSMFWFVVSKLRKLFFFANGFFATREANENRLSNTGRSKRDVMFFSSPGLPLMLVGAVKVRNSISVANEPSENIVLGHFNALQNDMFFFW